jgi:hypothetical protein
MQLPKKPKDDAPLEIPPVNAPFSSAMVAFQISVP